MNTVRRVATAAGLTIVLGVLTVCELPYNNPADPEADSHGGARVANDENALAVVTPEDNAYLEELEYLRLSPIHNGQYRFQIASRPEDFDAADAGSPEALLLDRDWDAGEYLPLPHDFLVPGPYFWRARARIGSDDSRIGSWTEVYQFSLFAYVTPQLTDQSSGPDMPEARALHAVGAVTDSSGDGRLFVAGGVKANGTDAEVIPTDEVYSIPLLEGVPHGSASTDWTEETTSLTTARSRAAVTAVDTGSDHYLYLAGGEGATGPLSSIEFASISSTGIEPFSTTGELPSQEFLPPSGFVSDSDTHDFGQGHRFFLAAGNTDVYALVANANSSYEITVENTDFDFQISVYEGSNLVNSRWYWGGEGTISFGGRSGEIEVRITRTSSQSWQNSAYRLRIDADLQPGAPISALSDGSLAAVSSGENHYLYLTGGRNGYAVSPNVYRSRVGSNGSLAAWELQTELEEPRFAHGLVAIDAGPARYLYAVGGWGRSSVEFAPIRDDGTLGEWQLLESQLPGRRGYAGVEVLQSAGRPWIVVAGGTSAAGLSTGSGTSTVYAAPVRPDGTLGEWETLDSLENTRWGFSMVRPGDDLLILGGLTGSTPTQDTSVLARAPATDVIPAPQITPADQTLTEALTVTITPPINVLNLPIDTYFTTDGTTPNTTDTLVTGTDATHEITDIEATHIVKAASFHRTTGDRSPVVTRTYQHQTAAFDFSVAEFANEMGTGNYNWRGYRFRLNEPLEINYLRGGGSGSGFEIALYEASGSSSTTVGSLIVSGELTGGTRGERVPVTETTLESGTDYIIAQGRASGSGSHYIVGSIDVNDLVSTTPFIEEWHPTNGENLNFGTSGSAANLPGRTGSSDSNRPDLGFGWQE